MDLIAFIGTFIAIEVASSGDFVVGTIILVTLLALLATYIDRVRKRHLVLPFSFWSWFVVLPVGYVASYVLDSPLYLGLALYYYGCICLVERKARWGPGFSWNTATRVQRPFAYWLVVTLVFTLSALCLIGGLYVLARAAKQN